jgi:phosphoglycerol transferase MdoB-like AlkP superfamily enzyme
MVLRGIFLLSLILLWKGYQSISLLIIPNLIVTAIILYLIIDISRFIGTLYALFYCSNNRLITKPVYLPV